MRLIVYWQPRRPGSPVLNCGTADGAAPDSSRIFPVTVNDATPPVLTHVITEAAGGTHAHTHARMHACCCFLNSTTRAALQLAHPCQVHGPTHPSLLWGVRSSTEHLQQALLRDQSTPFTLWGGWGLGSLELMPAWKPLQWLRRLAFTDGGKEEKNFRLSVAEKFPSGREEEQHPRLTFTFTFLLKHASLAKGYCNIYSVSVAPR